MRFPIKVAYAPLRGLFIPAGTRMTAGGSGKKIEHRFPIGCRLLTTKRSASCQRHVSIGKEL
jgi:hypothetical protein